MLSILPPKQDITRSETFDDSSKIGRPSLSSFCTNTTFTSKIEPFNLAFAIDGKYLLASLIIGVALIDRGEYPCLSDVSP